MKHLCEYEECIYFGQPTQASCRCHKTVEQMLNDELARLREAAMDLLTECEGDVSPSLGALAKLNEALKQ